MKFTACAARAAWRCGPASAPAASQHRHARNRPPVTCPAPAARQPASQGQREGRPSPSRRPTPASRDPPPALHARRGSHGTAESDTIAGHAPVAQPDRVAASEAVGRGFESLQARHIAEPGHPSIVPDTRRKSASRGLFRVRRATIPRPTARTVGRKPCPATAAHERRQPPHVGGLAPRRRPLPRRNAVRGRADRSLVRARARR